ncbi:MULTISPECIES: aspartate aminotransferase family protein [Phytobacter]|uniref:Aspartate aminotransferase family protein n=1 Tax=Phytobacter diazotrophicus TaxID=395631 RepID=A0ABM7VYY9_9ENTR|nr:MULTISPECIES: aspartate aminotransferase family protein [Phytobacter]MDU4150418.1 aspartate aminotransferase family protein [Enterobacteriaceae bacterium]MDU7380003.1 aspartate aminotransferase family protein [Enterobacteriaceae bacterium]BBE79119.1 aspartate aminotransferase family protein [Phytobacter sp. MRY16-398]BDD52497.1 aspartate aminotransferase family protein [Phytobacter diazotrophicus]BEG83425.1 aspartate aminotransferase family protein [Phytobacter diazotrophicus]
MKLALQSEMAITNDDVRQLDRSYVFHSWSMQGNLNPLVIAGAQGCELWDYDGNTYLDFSSQLVNVNIGYQHPRVLAAMKAQLESLTTIAPATANLARGEAAKRIVDLAPEGFSKVFFTNAGADANENAMRMARMYTGRDKIFSAYRSYHGNTGSAIVATGDPRRIPNEYARGHVHFFNPYLYRSEFNATTEEEECQRALAHLRRMIECEGPNSVAAILLESVPGTAGILVPPKGYMQGVRALADEFGIVLIVDEVMAGFGRTGSWFAFEQDGIVPDLITFAKGVNAGYVPAGGVIISEKISHYFDDHFFAGGLTYSGHPLAMSAIVATLDAMKDEKVVENAATVGDGVLRSGLTSLAQKHALIGDVRGRGMFQALELVTDRVAKTPVAAADMAAIKGALLNAGILPFVAENRIHVVPPCTMSAAEVQKGLAIFDAVLGQFGSLAKS